MLHSLVCKIVEDYMLSLNSSIRKCFYWSIIIYVINNQFFEKKKKKEKNFYANMGDGVES